MLRHDRLPAPPAARASALRRKAVVVPHDELRLDLLDRIHGDADHDQQRGAAEIEVDTQAIRQPAWQAVEDRPDQPEVVQVDTRNQHLWDELNDDQVHRADQRDAG